MICLFPRSSIVQAVRFNCPWHRNSFRPCIFPFKMHEKLKNDTVDARTKTAGGRLMLMRRVLREQKFLGYITSSRTMSVQ
ncbi:hypothetical protein PRIPAC_83752 [Pristionchus pacificus]|uniref:Uncharacterized protein n=1 Tax=Pristionchus pacificus TaxID=54126 RepID=A0A2A6BI90_PRIPA|nr:hypothetical protein PRIPAC_83752 [Pristionchus pacificus]|eukprot:PDM65620.1 hypothetical protein PRIPAC_53628 [Pristionchus pacificus]